MSIQNIVSATLPEQSKNDIKAKLSDIRSQLSFLVTLDPDQAKRLFRSGNGFAPFVEKIFAVAHDELGEFFQRTSRKPQAAA